jgi:hypothetical protein
MIDRSIAAFVAAVSIASGSPAAAQTPSALQKQLESIVSIEPVGGTPGSGLIVAVDAKTVHILTAKHVVEGSAPIADVDPAAQRVKYRCAQTALKVRFTFDPAHAVTSTEAYCSDVIDMAVIEVERPASLPESLPRFAEARSSTDRENYQVFLAGLALAPVPGEIISKADDELEIQSLGVKPGFSGGAVFDRENGFLGIIVTANGTRVTAVPVDALKQQLSAWNIPRTHIEGALVRDNTHFTFQRAKDARAEDARNAIRRYRSAFVGRDAGLLDKAYPDVKSKSQSLFGDSHAIELVLRECDDKDLARITCAFDMTVTRKTGRVVHARSQDYKSADAVTAPCGDPKTCALARMVFHLKESAIQGDPFGFQITKVCIEGTDDCEPPKKTP